MKKFLFIRMGNIGDILRTTALVRKIRHTYPDSRIDYMLSHKMNRVLLNNPYIDNVITFKKVTKVLRKLYRYIILQKIKFKSYTDVFILDSQENEKFWLENLISTNAKLYSFFEHDTKANNVIKFKVIENDINRVREYLRLYFDDIDNEDCDMDIFVDESSQLAIQNRFKDDLKKSVVLHSRTTETPPYRGFSVSENKDLITGLISRGYKVFLTGIEADIQHLNKLKEEYGNDVIVFAGEKFNDFISLLSLVTCVISPETGTAHIARALNTNLLVIAGPTDLAINGPVGTGNYTQVDLSCENGPCWDDKEIAHQRGCMHGNVVQCMSNIPQEIIDTIEKFNNGKEVKV